MNLPARLAYSQLRNNRRRAVWTLAGIILAVAMITAVAGFAVSGLAALYTLIEGELRDVYYATVYGIGAVLGTAVVAASVIVISNSFRVSAGERLTQFGMLKSVGATKRQIARVIMYESLFLSVAGIPAGVGTGLAVQFIGTQIASHFIEIVQHGVQREVPVFRMVISWQAVLLSVLVGVGTVALSAWLPARKAARIPAIDAIRRTGEVKLREKHLRAPRWVRTLFGFEGTLAAKSLKRSRRNFRATVVSLSISIVLFIAVFSFGTNLNRLARLAVFPMNADIIGEFSSRMRHVDAGDGEHTLVYQSVNNAEAERITARLRALPDAEVMSVGANTSAWRSLTIRFPADMMTPQLRELLISAPYDSLDFEINIPQTLITVDAQTYAELIRRAGVAHGSNLLVNHFRANVEGRWTEIVPFHFTEQTLTTTDSGFAPDGKITLHGELRGDDIPNELMHVSRGLLTVIVPELDAKTTHWFVQTPDPTATEAYMRGLFEALRTLTMTQHGIEPWVYVGNISAANAAERAIVHMVMIFTYGFAAMLTAIGLTNVISTLSTNIRTRSREFAVLQSVGMTAGGLKKMLNLESLLCAAKSLFYGVPLGVLVSFLLYNSIMQSVRFVFRLPWLAMIISVGAVFATTWAVMRFSVRQLRKNNIVETIRAVE